MNDLPIELILIMSAISQQATEHLFGAFLDGYKIKFASLGMGVATAFGFYALNVQGMGAYTYTSVIALGVLSGLGSNVVHGLLNRFAPAANAKPLTGVVKPDHPA